MLYIIYEQGIRRHVCFAIVASQMLEGRRELVLQKNADNHKSLTGAPSLN